MGLLDLTTDLRSLKYGRDQKGGGSSNQPFIQVPIPGYDEEFESNSTDFLLRDGALSRGVTDVERLGKFLLTIDGVLFLGKQTALSLQNPIVPGKPNRRDPGGLTGLYNPLATLEQVAINAIGGHIERQSLLPVNNPQDKYFTTVKDNYNDTNTNRLSILYNTKIADIENSTPPQLLASTAQAINLVDPLTLITYDVGSDSEFKTNIKIQNPTIRNNNLPNGEPLNTYQVGIDPFYNRGGFQLGSEGINILGVSSIYQGLSEINGDPLNIADLSSLSGINLDGQSNTYFGVTSDNTTLSTDSRGLNLRTYQASGSGNFYANGGLRLGANGIQKSELSILYALDGVNGEDPLGIGELSNLTGINEEGQQTRYFGPQDDNKTFSTDTKDLDLKTYQASGSGNFYARGGYQLGENGLNTAGASQKFQTSEIFNPEGSITPEDLTGINDTGEQIKPYGPQDNNTTLTTDAKGLDLTSYQNGLASPAARRSADPNAAEKYYIESNPPASYRTYGLGPGNADPVTLSGVKSSRDSELEAQQIYKFFIELLNNDSDGSSQYLYFRAYLDGISDSYSGQWNDVKYSGRAEKFYQYKGFNRDIGVDFTMYAHSQAEHPAIYEKLNTLLGAVTPDYSDIGYMRGTIARITVGSYFKDLPVVITSIGVGGQLDASWPGQSDSPEAPGLLRISMKMNPIHDFLPKKGAKFYSVA